MIKSYIYNFFENKKLLLSLSLFLVIIFGFLIRIIGIKWGLPLKKAHIDEAVVIFYTMRFFGGSLNPQVFFDYPTLFLYILWINYYFYFIVGFILKIFHSLDHFVGIYLNGDASNLYIIGRFLSAIFATLTIFLTSKIGKINFGNGVLPAFIMAIIPTHILHSHYATVDIVSIFFALLSIYFFTQYFNFKNLRNFYIGSFILGLAVATKYYPIIFIIPVSFFLFLEEKQKAFKLILIACALTVLGFIIGCPYSLLDFPAFSERFLDRLLFIVYPLQSGNDYLNLNLFNSIKVLYVMFTPLIFFWVIIGIIAGIYYSDNKRKYLLWLSYPIVFILFISTWKIVSPHYLLPAVPFLIIAASFGFLSLPIRKNKLIFQLLIILLISIPAFSQNIKTIKNLLREDTRLLAYKWIKKNIPPKTSILRFPYTPEFTKNDPYYIKVDWESKLLKSDFKNISKQYNYIIISGRIDNITKNSLLKYYKIMKIWEGKNFALFHHPRITVYEQKY